MENAGVPFLSSLEDIRDTSDNTALKDVLSEICKEVAEGRTFTQALASHPRVFKNIYISLIAAGEDTGEMGPAFARLGKYLKWQDNMQARIKKAKRYPTILSLAIFGTVLTMMTFVVPQIVGFLEFLGEEELPLPTKALIATTDFLAKYWWLVIVIIIGTIVGYKTLRKSSASFLHTTDSITLNLPVFGLIARKIEMARFCQTFGSLYDAGIDVVGGLKSSRNTIKNVVLHETVGNVIQSVRNGSSISESFGESGEFPSMIIRMIKVGEESGNLTDTLNQVTVFYEKDVDEAVDSMISYIEPALLLVMGGIILWIAVGVFAPIYDNVVSSTSMM